MLRKEKERITRMLESEGVEVIRVKGNKALVRVPDIYNQPATRWINLAQVDETTFIGA